MAARRINFERLYDIPERVMPPEILAAPTPSREDAQRELTRIAAAALGIATEPDLGDYFRLPRADSKARVAELVATITRQAQERAERDGTTLTVTAESVSGAVDFDSDLAAMVAGDHEGGDWPVIPTQAGHDAGVLSTQGIRSAMLFVRNPTGV